MSSSPKQKVSIKDKDLRGLFTNTRIFEVPAHLFLLEIQQLQDL